MFNRYSTMLAENLVDSSSRQHVPSSSVQEVPAIEYKDQTDVNGCTEPNVGMKNCYFLCKNNLYIF